MKRPSSPRPLVPVTCALAVGILLDRVLAVPVGYALAVAAAAVVVFVVGTMRRIAPVSAAAVYVLIAAAGAFSHHVQYHHVPQNDITHLASSGRILVSVRGKVLCEPWYRTFGSENQTRLATYDLAARELKVGDRWLPVSGSVRVRQYGGPMEIPFGARMQLSGMLRLPESATGPGQSDYREHLRRQGIRTLLTVSGWDHAAIIETKGFHPVRALAHHIRWKAKRTIDDNFRLEEGAILNAVLLGDKGSVEEDVLEDFAASGTMHFLAISGLHVGIIAGAIWWFLRRLWSSRKLNSVFVIAVLIVYAYVTGGRAPIVRATVMTTAFCFAMLIDREADILNILAAAALALLAVRPTSLFGAGFQLSFAAVFSIVRLMPIVMPMWKSDPEKPRPSGFTHVLKRYFTLALAVSLCAWLGTAPLVAKYFHLVTPIVVLVSPILLPVISVILIGGIVSVMIAVVSPVLAYPFVYATTALLTCLQKIVFVVSAVPLSHWYVPGALGPLVYYAGLIAVMGLNLPRRIQAAAISVLVLWNLGAGPLLYLAAPERRDAVTMIDVGKGNCVVVTSKDGSTVVYDAGSTTFRNVGERKLAPFLWDRGIRRIDALILSDSQADHANGVREIVRRFRVEKVIVSGHFNRFEGGMELKHLLQNDGLDVVVVTASRTMQCGAIQCDILWPTKEAGSLPQNDSSLVVRLTSGGRRILLTGDIEGAAVRELLRGPLDLRCEILQVPHHGRAMALAEEFAAAARPGVTFISDVEGRMSGRSAAVYARLGSAAYGTWDSGTITIDLETMSVSTFCR